KPFEHRQGGAPIVCVHGDFGSVWNLFCAIMSLSGKGGRCMPNIITHVLFAQEVLKNETNTEIAAVIERNAHLYAIGANGPDFLFFSHAKPWEAYKSHALNHLGSKMHAGK